MSTPSEVSSALARSLAGVAAPVARAVADDLQAIFPNAALRAGAPLQRFGAGRTAGRPRKPQAAMFGAVVVASFLGVAAGAMIGRDPQPAAVSPPRSSAEALQLLNPPPRPATQRLPNPGPLAPPQLVQTAAVAPAPRLVKTVVEPSRKHAPHARRKVAAVARCHGACGHDDVMAADARLRRAYGAASGSGVSRAVLVDYRNEWASLRHRGARQPRLLVARYGEMARDLDAYASRARAARDVRRPGASRFRSATFDGLRADLASLWP